MSTLKKTTPEEDAERRLVVMAMEHHVRIALDYLTIRAGGAEENLAAYMGIPPEILYEHRKHGIIPLYHLRDLIDLGDGLIAVSDLIPYLTGYPGIEPPRCKSGIWRDATAGELRPLEDLERLIHKVGSNGLATNYVRRRIAMGKQSDIGWGARTRGGVAVTGALPRRETIPLREGDDVRAVVAAIQARQHLDEGGGWTSETISAEDLHDNVADEMGGRGAHNWAKDRANGRKLKRKGRDEELE